MNAIKGAFQSFEFATALAVLSLNVSYAQNAIQFTAAKATVENAILLYWASNTNEVYEIDYADQLNTNADGTTAWTPLYTDYPSHGTNTFVADCGDYDLIPEIPHPRNSPMRFYRIVNSGTNTSPINPTVAITSPVNGASLSGNVVVTASSSSPEYLSEVSVFIDGEEQWLSGDGTNFVINTCEWPNGPHTVFAVARSQSTIDGIPYNSTVTFGSSASPYVNVTFNNLISRLDLSQRFFEPSEGQTQQVTATFAANVNWSLQIQDPSSNSVRTVTGSGVSMLFNWDGTGDGGASIPDGPYTYLLTAQTNGGPYLIQGGGGSVDTNPPPSPSFASSTTSATSDSLTEVFALPPDGSSIVPLAIYPPGFDTNGFILFEATWSDVMAPNAPAQRTTLNAIALNTASSDYSGPSSESTRGPTRKPRVGVKNKSGTYGIAYKTSPLGYYLQQPKTRNPIPALAFTGVDGGGRNSGYIYWNSLDTAAREAKAFSTVIQAGAYKPQFVLADEQWSPNDIKSLALGGNSIFRTCNFGLLSTHGCYGTYPEIDGIKYTYLSLFDEVNGGSYLRLSDMAFGSPGTAGMRWMTLLCCNMLWGPNITSMANNSKLPDNGNLHLLLGFNSFGYGSGKLGLLYASNLVSFATVRNSFVNACVQAYKMEYQNTNNVPIMTQPVTARVMGDNNCFTDTLYLYSDPDDNSGVNFQDTPVFP
jgi:hypothetical protein